MSADLVEVTQADRDWAHDAMKAADICGSGTLANVKAGRWDKNAYVQAFARHRLAAEASCEARVAEERERCARVAESCRAPAAVTPFGYDDACDDIAAAIRWEADI